MNINADSIWVSVWVEKGIGRALTLFRKFCLIWNMKIYFNFSLFIEIIFPCIFCWDQRKYHENLWKILKTNQANIFFLERLESIKLAENLPLTDLAIWVFFQEIILLKQLKGYWRYCRISDEFKIVTENCDGALLEIYLDHKFQWPQEYLNCESLAYEVVMA